MTFFQATGLLGAFNTIGAVLLSVRKCYKAQNQIGALVKDGLSSLDNIKQLDPEISRFVVVGGIDITSFCTIAGKIIRIADDFLKIQKTLQERNRIYRFCSASETVSSLEPMCSKLSRMEAEMRLLLHSLRLELKVSVLLEMAEPPTDSSREKQNLLHDARTAFGTRQLGSEMNIFVSQNKESVFYFIMGHMFLEGRSVEVNFERPASFFRRAINSGNIEALVYLGKQFQRGLGIKKDDIKAVQLFKKGAKLKDPECLYEMGKCFEHGHGVTKDRVKLFEYYKKAANVGHVGGKREVAYCLVAGIGTEVDLAEGAKYGKAAAEAGDLDAMSFFGVCLLNGNGVKKNPSAAVLVYKISANLGSVDALVRLGDCYWKREGVEEDEPQAFRLYSQAAADERSLTACARVGHCLVHGSGVAQNVAEGLRFLRNARKGGSWYAIAVLAKLYLIGIGVKKNKRKAFVLLKRAADAGHWSANLYLGEMYLYGEGMPVNIRKAIRHFEIMVKYEDVDSYLNLGYIYENEEGYQNENRALYHFRFAAHLGHSGAREKAGEYFVGSTGPRKMSFTYEELQSFLQNIKAQYSQRRNKKGQDVLAESVFYFVNPETELPSTQPAHGEQSNSEPESPQEIPLSTYIPEISSFQLLPQKYPYVWPLACIYNLCLLLSNILLIWYVIFR